MKAQVRDAFLAVHSGFSIDRVVADPDLNLAFLAECRRIGLTESATHLNRCLFNLRKSAALKGLPRARRTFFGNCDEYRPASEIAARYLERQRDVTLDDILCDPDLVRAFDEIAAELAPGFTALQYRWAALSLRKEKKLKPELLSRVVPSRPIYLGAVARLELTQVPAAQGLYIFYDRKAKQTLYVGESDNLRKRLQKHLEHSDNKSLARWFWDHGAESVYLELHQLSTATSKRVRRALESELIGSRHPLFNIQRY